MTTREEKEAFVSGLNGTTSIDAGAAILSAPALFFFSIIVSSVFPSLAGESKGWTTTGLHLLLVAVGQVYFLTVGADFSLAAVVAALLLSCLALFLKSTKRRRNDERKREKEEECSRAGFVTTFRAASIIVTIVSILAVDFRIYPRRYAKCEVYGVSVMDGGVGAMVFSAGLVWKPQAQRGGRALFVSLLQLFLLGSVRFFAVQGADYAQHVSEYGVHWNFFATLFFVKLFSYFLPSSFSGRSSLVVFLMGMQAVIVQRFGQFVLSEDRSNIIAANKEGITSLPGYCCMLTFGTLYADFVRTKRGARKLTSGGTVVQLCLFSTLLWVIYAAFSLAGIEASRRLLNPPYIVWAMGGVTTFLSAFSVFHYAIGMVTVAPQLWQRISDHQLGTFLIANILTVSKHCTVVTSIQHFLLFHLRAYLLPIQNTLKMPDVSCLPFLSFARVCKGMYIDRER
mmetsp:Transcript_31823/g.83079  ORF Transcript_31823/g.83079 Transcript_31823/m.83079 type:complete len:454 (-) Transcript_31823:50-1411(-)